MEERNKDYANLVGCPGDEARQHYIVTLGVMGAVPERKVDTYYDLATEFYEWGWGTSADLGFKMDVATLLF